MYPVLREPRHPFLTSVTTMPPSHTKGHPKGEPSPIAGHLRPLASSVASHSQGAQEASGAQVEGGGDGRVCGVHGAWGAGVVEASNLDGTYRHW